MKCPKCGSDVSEYENKQEEKEDKTIFLRIINAIQIITCIIIAIVSFVNEEIGNGFIIFIIGFVTFAFIKGFQDIIELLDNINNKLK